MNKKHPSPAPPVSDNSFDKATAADLQRHMRKQMIENDRQLFAQSPVRIIEAFLQAFDSDGQQTRDIPPHVIDAMGKRLRAFMAGGSTIRSLDVAFGGTTARQRNALIEANSDYDVVWDVHQTFADIANEQRPPREGGDFELTKERVGPKHGMSASNVGRIFTKAGRRQPS